MRLVQALTRRLCEACPCDAIRMDTGVQPGNLGFTRKAFVEDKKILTARSRNLQDKGKEGLYDEYLSSTGKCKVRYDERSLSIRCELSARTRVRNGVAKGHLRSGASASWLFPKDPQMNE